MVTPLDKTIVALIMALFAVADQLGYHFGVSEGMVTAIVTVATPLLVYVIPNKKPAPFKPAVTNPGTS